MSSVGGAFCFVGVAAGQDVIHPTGIVAASFLPCGLVTATAKVGRNLTDGDLKTHNLSHFDTQKKFLFAPRLGNVSFCKSSGCFCQTTVNEELKVK